MPRSRHRAGRPYQRLRDRVFALWGDTCWICGHSGAGEMDHLDALVHDPDQPLDPERMRPAHGSSAPCPVCVTGTGRGRSCNQERGTRPTASVFRPNLPW